MCLCSVKMLSIQASGMYERGKPRGEKRALKMPDGTTVMIRDQEPLLRKGQLALEPGFSIEDLVEMLVRCAGPASGTLGKRPVTEDPRRHGLLPARCRVEPMRG
jgi:hypothetical protein